MNILALDIATKTGWAYRVNGQIVSGVEDFSLKRGDSPGMRYIRFSRWLSEFISQEDLLCVYEQPHNRGGAPTEVLFGLLGQLISFCAARGFEHTAVKSTELKKHATGKGNAKKDKMIAVANNIIAKGRGVPHGPPIVDDNEADAVCLLNYAEKELF
jgi:hypothetical protein